MKSDKKTILFILLGIFWLFGWTVPSYAGSEEVSAASEEVSVCIEEDSGSALVYSGDPEEETEIIPAAEVRADTNRLEGRNLLCYERLMEEIRLIAGGERASAVVEITLDELGITETSWTAEELGVEDIITVNENGEKAISQEAVAAVNERINAGEIRVMPINSTLLQNAPYELFWYDKTIGLTMVLPAKNAVCTDGEWRISLTRGFVFKFAVSEAYSDGEYTVDTEAASGTKNAVERARETAASSAHLSDTEKLLAYREYICSQVSYDRNTASDGTASYGDPWQVIYVFDDDPATNVVCEGYAKAFKLLCDLTEFDSDMIGCITVSGSFCSDPDETPEGHMWNIVSMEDNGNYLVDLTNCDSGMIGAPVKLFLAGGVTEEQADAAESTMISLGGSTVEYSYDDRTTQLFTAEELAVSRENYFLKADYSAVEEALAKVPADLSLYTQETSEALQAAVDSVDYSKDISAQAEVNAMAEQIEAAVSGLKVKVTGITLDKKSVKIRKWGTGTLTAQVSPSDAAVRTVKWSSSDTQIVTVNSKGFFRARKTGTALITAETKDGGFKAVCKITVYQPVKSVKLNRTSAAVKKGCTLQLTAAVRPSDATNQKVVWTSSDPSVVRVNSKGLIRGLKAGTAKITVTTKDGGLKAVCTVTVKKQ